MTRRHPITPAKGHLIAVAITLVSASAAHAAGVSPYGEPGSIISPYPEAQEYTPLRADSITAYAAINPDSIAPDPLIREVCRNSPVPFRAPAVFREARILTLPEIRLPKWQFRMPRRRGYDADRFAGITYAAPILSSELEEGDEVLSISDNDTIVWNLHDPLTYDSGEWEEVQPPVFVYDTPRWISLRKAVQRQSLDLEYVAMMLRPESIRYLYSHLPVPPKIKDDRSSYSQYLMHRFMPTVDVSDAVLPHQAQQRVYWLHTVGSSLQFSQAYISDNWYQGGNDYLALLFNFNWDVALNTVYHPNLMFTSSLSYKLAVNSNSREALHRYSISQDAFQYNLKAGVKAFRKWFYSFNLQFKTQIFNTYPADSPDLTSAFLSPADLNMGLGMTYNTDAMRKTLQLSVSVSPISYNLKACMSDRIDHAQFNILPGRHTRSEVGSNAEATLSWDITPNISWKSRMFLFTDYHYFQADWENTFTFNINRFLSTQFYIHPRYDSSTLFGASKWHYWQLKEILSFGLSYTFSTKP